MKTYNIPVVWQSYKIFQVQAETLEQAIEFGLKEFLSIPDEDYLEDSFEIDGIVEENYPNETFNLSKIVDKL